MLKYLKAFSMSAKGCYAITITKYAPVLAGDQAEAAQQHSLGAGRHLAFA